MFGSTPVGDSTETPATVKIEGRCAGLMPRRVDETTDADAPGTVSRQGLSRHAPLAVTCLVLVLTSLLLRHWLFPYGYSGDADEGTYVLQAKVLSHGHVTLSARSFGGALRPWLTGEAGGRIFTQYLPGWPAVLAAFGVVRGMA